MSEHSNLARARGLLHAATQLIELANDLENEARGGSERAASQFEPSDVVLVELARQIYGARRKRSIMTDWRGLFGEPAWDMLLELFIAAHEGRDLSVTSICGAADVPLSTALRWLSLLESRGLVVRQDDPDDHRRQYIRISAPEFAEFNRYIRYIADRLSAYVLLATNQQEVRPEPRRARILEQAAE